MAVLDRAATNPKSGASDPGYYCRPVNDYFPVEITMDVAVEAGQAVYMKANGRGALAVATGSGGAINQRVLGISMEKAPAGRRVALCAIGKMTGWTGGTPGDVIYLSDTAGEIGNAAGTNAVKLGTVHEFDNELTTRNTIFFNIAP